MKVNKLNWYSDVLLDGEYIKRIEFEDRYDEFFETMEVEFKLN